MDLQDYRQRIDEIDRQMVELFCQRMEIATQIADYKKAHQLPTPDAKREQQKLEGIASQTPEPFREYTAALYSLIFELSRSCQDRRLDQDHKQDGNL